MEKNLYIGIVLNDFKAVAVSFSVMYYGGKTKPSCKFELCCKAFLLLGNMVTAPIIVKTYFTDSDTFFVTAQIFDF